MKKAALIIFLSLAIASCGKENPDQESGTTGLREDYVVTRIEYHLDDSAVIEQLPDYVASDQLHNNTPELILASRTFTFEVKESSSFLSSGDVSVPEGFYAPVPYLMPETNSIFLTEPRYNTWGEDSTTSDVRNVEVSLNTPPYSSVNVTVSIKRYRMTVRYTAYLKGVMTGMETSVDGIWEGVSSSGTETIWTQQDLD